jgi:AAA+ superfamily predicted ATPase
MENLDAASLRRFDLKLEFDYLQAKQAWKMFFAYAKELDLPADDSLKNRVESLKYLTPGDFAAVKRQSRFNPIKSLEDFVERLEAEVAVKNIEKSNVMGFVNA